MHRNVSKSGLARGSCWSTRGLHTVMVNSGTQFGKVIIKVAHRVRAGCAQSKHSPKDSHSSVWPLEQSVTHKRGIL